MIGRPIIFTDLDGTLLDHHNYSFDAALPVLEQLKSSKVPVIATTSKTKAEVLALYKKVRLNTPFIVENGAAIYLPKSQFTNLSTKANDEGEYWQITFSKPRHQFQQIIEQLRPEFGSKFIAFSDMSTKDITRLTGLIHDKAELAQQRQFGEPVQWLGNEIDKQLFIDKAKQLGAGILVGGRFIHLSGDCDKGKALTFTKELYKVQWQHSAIITIALGDSGNDIAMLEAADIAVQIRSPSHSYPILKNKTQQFIYQSQGYGPVGWSEALTFILNLSATEALAYG